MSGKSSYSQEQEADSMMWQFFKLSNNLLSYSILGEEAQCSLGLWERSNEIEGMKDKE